MYDPFIGEVRLWPSTRIPKDWAPCDGREMPINGNQALFSLLGTLYGGDGGRTFNLPDLRGTIVVGGTASQRRNSGGSETVSLTVSEMPAHNHEVACTSQIADQGSPEDGVLANLGATAIYGQGNAVLLNEQAIGATGTGKGHNNIQPSLALQYIICLAGNYPPHN